MKYISSRGTVITRVGYIYLVITNKQNSNYLVAVHIHPFPTSLIPVYNLSFELDSLHVCGFATIDIVWQAFFQQISPKGDKLQIEYEYVATVFLQLKYGSEEKGSSLCKCSILLGFFMSKKQERLRSELLSEDKITNLLVFLT